MPATSHSPRSAAARPPCEPTQSVLDVNPRSREQAEQQVQPDAVRADRDEVGRLDPPAERDAPSTASPASRYSWCRGITTNPSAG